MIERERERELGSTNVFINGDQNFCLKRENGQPESIVFIA